MLGLNLNYVSKWVPKKKRINSNRTKTQQITTNANHVHLSLSIIQSRWILWYDYVHTLYNYDVGLVLLILSAYSLGEQSTVANAHRLTLGHWYAVIRVWWHPLICRTPRHHTPCKWISCMNRMCYSNRNAYTVKYYAQTISRLNHHFMERNINRDIQSAIPL